MRHRRRPHGPSAADLDELQVDLEPIEIEIEIEIILLDVSPGDLSPPDLSPQEIDACDPHAVCLAELRQQIEAERRASLREREDVDSDASFPASDPPAH